MYLWTDEWTGTNEEPEGGGGGSVKGQEVAECVGVPSSEWIAAKRGDIRD